MQLNVPSTVEPRRNMDHHPKLGRNLSHNSDAGHTRGESRGTIDSDLRPRLKRDV